MWLPPSSQFFPTYLNSTRGEERSRAEMGKYLKKRRADGELSAVGATEVVGFRGLGVSSKRRKTAPAALAGESEAFAASYLQLRSRRVCMSSRIEGSRKFSGHASCVVATASPASTCFLELGGRFDTVACYASRGETTDEARNLEPTAEPDHMKRRAAAVVAATPSEAEIEEFFAAAERNVRQRFADKYNFDVGNDAPLVGGRYEWVPLLVIR